VVSATTQALDRFDLSGAAAVLEDFLDVLTNWYIRRSRDRFWGTGEADPADSKAAFDTLATVLEVFCRLAAPLMPMVTEAVWRGLTGGESVHLTDWPEPALLPTDAELVADMDLARAVCSAAHSVRKANHLRARLPLRSLTVAGPEAARLEGLVDLIADEVNVKQVLLVEQTSAYAEQRLSVNFKLAAPRLGPATQAVALAARQGDWDLRADGRARVGPAVLEPEEFELKVAALDDATTRSLPGRSAVVVMDLTLEPSLVLEGRARDLVREVQEARRDRGLDVTDRIRLDLQGDEAQLGLLLERFGQWVAEQVLATELTLNSSELTDGDGWRKVRLPDGLEVAFRLHPVG